MKRMYFFTPASNKLKAFCVLFFVLFATILASGRQKTDPNAFIKTNPAAAVISTSCQELLLRPYCLQSPTASEDGPAVILIYTVRGIKSQSDVALLDNYLKKMGLAIETSFNLEKENAWITAESEELNYKIKDALLDTKGLLGYEISVDYLTSIQSKTK